MKQWYILGAAKVHQKNIRSTLFTIGTQRQESAVKIQEMKTP
jgi:hypothetical protein